MQKLVKEPRRCMGEGAAKRIKMQLGLCECEAPIKMPRDSHQKGCPGQAKMTSSF